MPTCQVPGCEQPRRVLGGMVAAATFAPVVGNRVGIELALTVKDIAVVLALCDFHADVLAAAAWDAIEERLGDWGWPPLPPR